MKGFVPTPAGIVDLMVDKLFRHTPPQPGSSVLDPGCGGGGFIDGVVRWCSRRALPLPKIVGVEADAGRAREASARFEGVGQIQIRHADFLRPVNESFDYVIGNPPYVPITSLSVAERELYRSNYETAKGRFDLYLLFFEQALKLLAPGGRLVLITPEKFVYVDSARPLRELLRQTRLEELHFLDERSFGELVTYPLVSTVTSAGSAGATRVVSRSGVISTVCLKGSSSWLPTVLGHTHAEAEFSLADACVRISCGVATGADSAFVLRTRELTPGLAPFAHPTIAGREISEGIPLNASSSMLLPYDAEGELLPEKQLNELGRFLSEPTRRAQLLGRTCVGHKPWYAFHENPPLREMLRPKLLCKDITATPFFVLDCSGKIIPRHSAYYLVPIDGVDILALGEHLNSTASRDWLRTHCQRAANGFLRLQSRVLKQLPLPPALVPRQYRERQLRLGAVAVPA